MKCVSSRERKQSSTSKKKHVQVAKCYVCVLAADFMCSVFGINFIVARWNMNFTKKTQQFT